MRNKFHMDQASAAMSRWMGSPDQRLRLVRDPVPHVPIFGRLPVMGRRKANLRGAGGDGALRGLFRSVHYRSRCKSPPPLDSTSVLFHRCKGTLSWRVTLGGSVRLFRRKHRPLPVEV